MTSVVLVKFLESLRQRRKINQNTFVEGIISLRQYKRYLSGDSEMPYRVLSQLSERLGFHQVKILTELEKEKANQNALVEKFYNHVARNEYTEADEFMRKYNVEDFIQEDMKLYYKVTVVLLDYTRNDIDKEEAAKRLKTIMNYPEILKKDLYEQTELLGLSSMLSYLEDDERLKLMDRLSKLLLEDKITLGVDYYAKNYLVVRLARAYGMIGDNDEVINLCEKAIELSSRPQSYINLDFLYYYLILAYRNKKDDRNSLYYVRKLYYFLHFRDDDRMFNKYKIKMHNDLGKSFEELLGL